MAAKKRASLGASNPLDQIFTPSTQPKSQKKSRAAKSAEAAPAGSAITNSGELKQTTFILYEDQLEWLDDVCYNAKRKGGKRVNKTVVIRSLVAFARAQGLNLEGVRSEEAVYERVSQLNSAK